MCGGVKLMVGFILLATSPTDCGFTSYFYPVCIAIGCLGIKRART